MSRLCTSLVSGFSLLWGWWSWLVVHLSLLYSMCSLYGCGHTALWLQSAEEHTAEPNTLQLLWSFCSSHNHFLKMTDKDKCFLISTPYTIKFCLYLYLCVEVFGLSCCICPYPMSYQCLYWHKYSHTFLGGLPLNDGSCLCVFLMCGLFKTLLLADELKMKRVTACHILSAYTRFIGIPKKGSSFAEGYSSGHMIWCCFNTSLFCASSYF